jgi:hypothetical protein
MLDKVKSAHPSREVELWFADEARFGQQGTVTGVWAKTGSRPRAVRQIKYEWLMLSVQFVHGAEKVQVCYHL